MNLPRLAVRIAACAAAVLLSPSSAAFAGQPASPSSKSAAADWVLSLDSASVSGPLSPALLGQYDLSGALYRFDEVPGLAAGMKGAGFAEWRVGLGRWEFATQLLPTLTDGTACSAALAGDPAEAFAPAGTTDLDLIRARDWFADTDGTPVTAAMTSDDARYRLDYIRSVLDVASAFGAVPFVDIDLMPRALAANRTPVRSTADSADPCGNTWTNRVSNARPADPAVFAAAAAGVVRRVVEGSDGEAGRPVRYWEMWNEADAGYAWDPVVGNFHSYLETAADTLVALDAYRKTTANPDGRAIRIGLGGFASVATAVAVLPVLDGAGIPFDFISFHTESSDDPLAVAAQIRQVASAVRASANPSAEVLVTEWSANLGGSTLDPGTMDLPLFDATVVALGASAGVTHMHHAIFWDYFGEGSPGLGILGHDLSPKPAYRAFEMLADVVGDGSSRLAPPESPDGLLDGGAGAMLASRDSEGRIHVLFANRGNAARTASVGAMPTSVTVFDDPSGTPRSVAPSVVVTVPVRSLVLVERPAAAVPAGRQTVILPAPRRRHAGASDAQIVFEAPGVPGDGNIQEIFTMNLDGSRLTQVTHDGLSKFLPHFSPDGTRLVYTKFFVGQYGQSDAQTDVVAYRFASGTETRLTVTGTAFQPVWSPDGSRIAYGSITGESLWIMDADGGNAHRVGAPSGAGDDMRWNDFAWSQDDWILFTVGQLVDGCFKVRLDKIRPDGSARTQVTDGGPNCTTPGKEQSGDADPGFSADGRTIFSSRGFPNAPPGFPGNVVRRLYSFSSGAWTPGKTENDLSLPVRRDCIEGVPKGSPDGTRVLLFRACQGEPHMGVTLTDNAGSYRTWLVDGFGADWNPVAQY